MSTLRDELEKRIKRKEALSSEHQKLLGRKEQLEKELQQIRDRCSELGFIPEDLPHIIKSEVQDFHNLLDSLDSDLDAIEGQLKPFR